jgi:hypothetical protein
MYYVELYLCCTCCYFLVHNRWSYMELMYRSKTWFSCTEEYQVLHFLVILFLLSGWFLIHPVVFYSPLPFLWCIFIRWVRFEVIYVQLFDFSIIFLVLSLWVCHVAMLVIRMLLILWTHVSIYAFFLISSDVWYCIRTVSNFLIREVLFLDVDEDSDYEV